MSMRADLATLVEGFRPSLEDCGLFTPDQVELVLAMITSTFKKAHYLGAAAAVALMVEELNTLRVELAAIDESLGEHNSVIDGALTASSLIELRVSERLIELRDEMELN